MGKITCLSSIEFNNEVIFLKLSLFTYSLLTCNKKKLSFDKLTTYSSKYLEPDSKSLEFSLIISTIGLPVTLITFSLIPSFNPCNL